MPCKWDWCSMNSRRGRRGVDQGSAHCCGDANDHRRRVRQTLSRSDWGGVVGRELDRDQQFLHVGEVAQVAPGSLLDPREPVVVAERLLLIFTQEQGDNASTMLGTA